MSEQFRVQGIDHIELCVPDQYDAAAWYEKVLGLAILPKYEHWASDGPLMISSDNGSTMIALFQCEPLGDGPLTGIKRLAFRTDGTGFLRFLRSLETHEVYEDGKRITSQSYVDHDLSWSVYFRDPWGYPIEITSYDYDAIKVALSE